MHLKSALRLALPLLLGLLLGPGLAAEASREAVREGLAGRLASRVSAAGLPQGRYGIAVIERGARPRVVYAHGHTLSLKPASVAKVLTAAAALDLLGPAHVFKTLVTARGELEADGTLVGDLVVHGTGDPNLSGRFHDGDATRLLAQFVGAVKEAGIRRVTGSLVLDDGLFDRDYFHPSWKASDRARWYGAGVAGLAFNDGCADLRVRGGKRAGARGTVEASSTLGPWQLESRVTTSPGGRPTVGGVWVRNESALRVQGRIPPKTTYTFSHPVPDPLRFFGGAFLRMLDREHVHVAGGVRVAEDRADRRQGTTSILRYGSALGPTLRVMNQRSQNFYAAMVFKAAGARVQGQGSWATGEQAVGEMLRRRGLDPKGQTRIVDGSGLSLDNRTSAATVARLLTMFEQDLLRGPALYASLAVPGGEGTLRKRLKRGDLPRRLHAKTGTLARSGVHAMAGYVDGKDDTPGYAFAILLNTSKGGRAFIDGIVEEIARP
jgi:D-alanyl-D-alanine carboxypeptidase/D-alanyl-D-alanine-endopeptidase (penicillin-binding protein 4)